MKKKGLFLSCILLFLGVLIWKSLIFYKAYTQEDFSVLVLDKDEAHLRSFLTEDQSYRFPFALSDLHEWQKSTILCLEDRYFYSHPGLNPFAIARAAVANLSAGRIVSGASTIDMQLVKQYMDYNRTIIDKLEQSFLGVFVNLIQTKDQILERYLSKVSFGGNYIGLKTAAYSYFQKPVRKLSMLELVFLMTLPQRPKRLSTLTGEQWTRLIHRRLKQIDHQCFGGENKKIKVALGELVRIPKPRLNHRLYATAEYLKQSNPQKNVLKTSLDIHLQNSIREVLSKYKRSMFQKRVYNIGVLVTEVRSGKVRAAVSNWDPLSQLHGQQIYSMNVVRSVGSTLKPLLVGLALEKSLITPESLLLDGEIFRGDYNPENYDQKYRGLITVESALHKSLNTPFVRLLKAYGMGVFVDDLNQAGIRPASYLGLGGILGGTRLSLHKLSEVYLAMASDGYLRKPSWSSAEKSPRGELIFSQEAAEILYESLKANPATPSDLGDVAWKTGTSMGFRDAWVMGYNQKYLVSVWLGNLDYRPARGLTGGIQAKPMMFDIFRSLKRRSVKSFYRVANEFGKVEVCQYSGYRANRSCPKTKIAKTIRGKALSHVCPFHQSAIIDMASGQRLTPGCYLPTKSAEKSLLVFPQEVKEVYEKMGWPVLSEPEIHPSCKRTVQGGGASKGRQPSFKILSPQHKKIYFSEDEDMKIPFTILGSQNITHCHLNGHRYSLFTPHKYLQLKKGRHVIQCIDKHSSRKVIEFQVAGF